MDADTVVGVAGIVASTLIILVSIRKDKFRF